MPLFFFDAPQPLAYLSKKEMLYLPNHTLANIQVPKVSTTASGTTLRLRSTIDLTEVVLEVEVVQSDAIWMTIEVDIPQLQGGEYEYTLLNDGVAVSNGVAIVAIETIEIEAYEQEETYKQYDE